MDNPETREILGTRHRTKTHKTKTTTQRMSTTDQRTEVKPRYSTKLLIYTG